MIINIKKSRKILRYFFLISVSILLLGGCASNRANMQMPDYSGLSTAQTQATLAQLSAQYRANPRNKNIIINFAAVLRAVGQSGQAVAVLQQAISIYPKDMDIKIAYAKALAADGKFSQALTIIDQTIMPDNPDWNALLVKGAILDQMGQNQAARKLYIQALTISPNQASIEANLGLSYAMTNNLAKAEEHLLRAVSMANATSQIKQNLALIYGLQGKFDKARAIYSQLLPPEQVKSNMAYIRALLTQQNNWDKIADGD